MPNPIRADKVKPERVEWLWRERIPRGMMTIFAGRPDQGKGLACAHVAADISNAVFRDHVTGKARYGQVFYCAMEDSYGIMTRPRLEAAGARLENIHLDRIQLPGQMDYLEEFLTLNPVDLFVIDPLAAVLNRGVRRQSDNIREFLNPLTDLIERTRTAVLVVEHVLKRPPQSGFALSAIGGSGSGIVAASRMAFLFGVDPADDDRRILVSAKANIRERPKAIAFEIDAVEIDEIGDVPYLLYEKELDSFDAMKLLTTKRDGAGVGRPADKRAAAAEWLTTHLYTYGPLKAGQVFEDAKQYGMTAKTLRRAAEDMEVIKTPPGGGRSCVWSLPDEIRQIMDEANEGIKTDSDPPPESETVDGEPMMLTDDDFKGLLGGGDDS